MRQRITAHPRGRRYLDERLLNRFPGLAKLTAHFVWRLPTSSWLRRRLVARAIRLSFEAFNRRDYESAFALFHADIATTFPPELSSVGFAKETHGLLERVDAQRRWNDEWGQFRNEPEELIDLGNRMLILGRLTGSGKHSGVEFDTKVAYLFDVSGGLAINEQMFMDHAAALRAAGLSEKNVTVTEGPSAL
jgi:ketosteroid isomerase-like protein